MREATAMYRYRCGQCRSTSPSVSSRAALALEQRSHRFLFHGGHIPDGERIIEPAPFVASDIPLRQWVIGGIMTLAIIAGILLRHL
ncbi:hypothetical protein [Streptomyces sp. TR1341]|uniref:hypothetical protein n=1 Tax=Streptomyces sp. TR1341 TaxID=2601266 RepID=UPI003083F9C2